MATTGDQPGTIPQPPPTPGDGDVWGELISSEPDPELVAMYAARRRFGIEKYKTPLQRDNGRDHLEDLRQEILDAIVYAQAARRHDTVHDLRNILLTIVADW